jgi:hypothetical protein
MRDDHRAKILAGDSIRREWKIGKYLYQGVTEKGFPFVAWANRDFGSLLVGKSRDGIEPRSKLRNDTRSGINVNSFAEAKTSADWMSREIVR